MEGEGLAGKLIDCTAIVLKEDSPKHLFYFLLLAPVVGVRRHCIHTRRICSQL